MELKPVIYQLFPRLFTNTCEKCVKNGTIEQNGAGKMNQITADVLHGIKELGITHIWYTGVIEHAHCTDYSKFGIEPDNPHVVKGKAGSPYAISDYYDIDPDIAEDIPARMKEFENLVARTHKAGMKVIIDFVPNHVARRYKSDVKPKDAVDFGANDNPDYFFKEGNDFYYITRQMFCPSIDLGQGEEAYVEFPAKASGNDCFTAFPGINDWYETVKLNYGVDFGNGSRHFYPVPPVWNKMADILRFWVSKGVDGFRCDMAFMVPVEFWEKTIPEIKKDFPSTIFIAEIYDVALYRDFIFKAHFDYLYDKVNLYDTLRGVQCCNVSAAQLTNCWQTVEGLEDYMLNFLENHDEQRFASEFYAASPWLVLPSLVVSAMFGKGPVMIYAGQELGETASDEEGFSGRDGRTTIFDYWSVPTVRRWYNNGKCDGAKLTAREKKLRQLYAKVLNLCNSEKAISAGKFFDLMYVNYSNPSLNPHRQFVFLRHHEDVTLLIAVNFDNNACRLRINIPQHAFGVLGITAGASVTTELLGGEKVERDFDWDDPFDTYVDANGAVIWKIQPKRKKINKQQ